MSDTLNLPILLQSIGSNTPLLATLKLVESFVDIRPLAAGKFINR